VPLSLPPSPSPSTALSSCCPSPLKLSLSWPARPSIPQGLNLGDLTKV
jgi:hypothetical protein